MIRHRGAHVEEHLCCLLVQRGLGEGSDEQAADDHQNVPEDAVGAFIRYIIKGDTTIGRR